MIKLRCLDCEILAGQTAHQLHCSNVCTREAEEPGSKRMSRSQQLHAEHLILTHTHINSKRPTADWNAQGNKRLVVRKRAVLTIQLLSVDKRAV